MAKSGFCPPVSTHSRPKAAGAAKERLGGVCVVSTHSRPKAAGKLYRKKNTRCWVSTHSRPKAAGFGGVFHKRAFPVSTHSRPKAAGVCAYRNYGRVDSFNTQPPEGGWVATSATVVISGRFQHTAARRRLDIFKVCKQNKWSFNTQPPEGGWVLTVTDPSGLTLFQHTAARRRLESCPPGRC